MNYYFKATFFVAIFSQDKHIKGKLDKEFNDIFVYALTVNLGNKTITI